jgi:hypothetical protein
MGEQWKRPAKGVSFREVAIGITALLQFGIRCSVRYQASAKDQRNFEEKLPAAEHDPYFPAIDLYRIPQ